MILTLWSDFDFIENPYERKYADMERTAPYRILDRNGLVMYTGTDLGSWFTLEQAKELVNRDKGEMIYEFDFNGNRLWEIL